MKRPEHMTLRILLEYLKKQQKGDIESVMDIPLSIGISDGYRNFDIGTIFIDYPRFSEPFEDYKGSIRIDCHLTNKRLVEDKNKG